MAQKTIQKKKEPIRMVECSVYCHCGNLPIQHFHGGCRAMVEGTECEDHWMCGCNCVQCIHKTEYSLKQIAKDIDAGTW